MFNLRMQKGRTFKLERPGMRIRKKEKKPLKLSRKGACFGKLRKKPSISTDSE